MFVVVLSLLALFDLFCLFMGCSLFEFCCFSLVLCLLTAVTACCRFCVACE